MWENLIYINITLQPLIQPFRSWDEKLTKILKNHPYTPKAFIFIHKTPVVENPPTAREIRDLLRPRSIPKGNTVCFYMSTSFFYMLKTH